MVAGVNKYTTATNTYAARTKNRRLLSLLFMDSTLLGFLAASTWRPFIPCLPDSVGERRRN
jgi:hypothetical protein